MNWTSNSPRRQHGASGKRHIDDSLAGVSPDFCVGHLDRYNAVVDVHRLLTMLDLQRAVYLQYSVHTDSDADLLIDLKSGSADLEFILSNWN